jgi:hypothetical protein
MDKILNHCKGFVVSAIDDGTYDIIVVDAIEGDDGTMTIEIAVSSGSHRGEVLTLNATHLGRSWSELLASPGTLTIAGGRPHLTFDA